MSVEALDFSYGDNEVLKSVTFSAEYGEFLSVLGPNGVGKSTLFRCMLGLLTPSGGGTFIDGRAVAQMDAAELSKSIAYIPQSHAPAFNFTVFDMVLMGTTAQLGRFSSPREPQRRQAENALERLDIAHLKDRGYRNISGGERQLVLIARALAQQAKILLMDEPSSNLDFGNKMKVMQTVKSLTSDGYAVIQSTHDPDQAYLYSDKVLALLDGRVLAWGTPREVVCAPVMSALYGGEVEVFCLRGDSVRTCVPADMKLCKGKGEEK